jgi:hypothetical protein
MLLRVSDLDGFFGTIQEVKLAKRVDANYILRESKEIFGLVQ